MPPRLRESSVHSGRRKLVFVYLRQRKIEQLEQASDDELEASLLSLVAAAENSIGTEGRAMPDLSTCGELADYLATQPRDRKIVLSNDAEGNGFSPLADAEESMYTAETTWRAACTSPRRT